jgi:hypothetical protein
MAAGQPLHLPLPGSTSLACVLPGRPCDRSRRLLPAAGSPAALAEQEGAGGGPLDVLLHQLAALARGAGPQLAAPERQLLAKLLSWPADKLFPALDALRCAVLEPGEAAAAAAGAGSLSGGAAPGTLGAALGVACCEGAPPAAAQTGLRLACNCCKHSALRAWLLAQRAALLDGCAALYSSATKGVRLGLATLLLNLAVAYRLEPGLASDAEGKMQVGGWGVGVWKPLIWRRGGCGGWWLVAVGHGAAEVLLVQAGCRMRPGPTWACRLPAALAACAAARGSSPWARPTHGSCLAAGRPRNWWLLAPNCSSTLCEQLLQTEHQFCCSSSTHHAHPSASASASTTSTLDPHAQTKLLLTTLLLAAAAVRAGGGAQRLGSGGC